MLNDLQAIMARLQGVAGGPAGGRGGMAGLMSGFTPRIAAGRAGGSGAITGNLLATVDSGQKPSLAPNVAAPGSQINRAAVARRLNGK